MVIGPPLPAGAVQRSPLAFRGPLEAHSHETEPIEPTAAVGDLWVQREPTEPAAAASSGTEPETATLSAAATTGPAAAAGASGERSETDVEELLRALYPSLRRRLCRDLLLDRERAGYRTDIRF